MSRRRSLFAYSALLVGVVAFASSFVRLTSGQQAALGPAVVGRYHVAATANAGSQHLYVTDTITGQTWHQSSFDGKWNDLGSPIAAK
jgi:hypothetical protein